MKRQMMTGLAVLIAPVIWSATSSAAIRAAETIEQIEAARQVDWSIPMEGA